MAIDCLLHGDPERAAAIIARLPYARLVDRTGMATFLRETTTDWFFVLDVDMVFLDDEGYQFLQEFDPDAMQLEKEAVIRITTRGFANCVHRDYDGKRQPYHVASPLRDAVDRRELGEKWHLDTHEFRSTDIRTPYFRFCWAPDHYAWAEGRTVHVADRGCRFTLQPLLGEVRTTEYQDLIRYRDNEQMEVFMLTTGRDFVQENWDQLKKLCPRAKLFRSATDILNSHRAVANLSATEHFFVVDADNWVTDATPFDYVPRDGAVFATHVWYASNPLGIQAYGHGGIKLFPKYVFMEPSKMSNAANRMDVTMGTAEWMEVHPLVASEHRFDTSHDSIRRTASREIRKLAQAARHDTEAMTRLRLWAEAGRHHPAILQAIQEQA